MGLRTRQRKRLKQRVTITGHSYSLSSRTALNLILNYIFYYLCYLNVRFSAESLDNEL